MVLRSTDDDDLFENKAYNFSVQLDKQRHLEESWAVALIEITLNYSGTTKKVIDLYVYSDVCDGILVGKTEMPLLRRVRIDTNNTIKTSKTLSTNMIFETPYTFPFECKI